MSKKHYEKYDYIVVGAGAGGSIVAARLAEDKNVTVLLLESGHDNTYTSSNISNYDKEIIRDPGLNAKEIVRYHNNPDIKKCKGLEVSPTLLDYVTTLQNDSRTYAYPRGTGAGGSTNHHNMVDGRGSSLIYDNIAEQVDDPIWTYNNILPYYKKMESYNIPNADPKIHGKNGWLQVKKSRNLNQDLSLEIVKALKDVYNVPYRTDPANPEQVAGVYIAEVQADKNGNRSNAFINLLEPMLKKQTNIKVQYNSLVGKVILKKKSDSSDKSNNLIAKGVVVYEKPFINYVDVTGNKVVDSCNVEVPNKELPKPTKIYARREVILCAGAINTPQILMLSGIGPKKHLEELNIKIKKDLEGVGNNLMDHIESNLVIELDPTKFMWQWQATWFKENTNYKKLCSPAIQKTIEKYYNPLSSHSNVISMIWDWYSGKVPKNLISPDLHTHIIDCFNFDWNYDIHKFPKGDYIHVKEHKKDNYLPSHKDPLNKNGIPHKKTKYINSQYDPCNPRVFMSFLAECLHIKATGQITLKDKKPTTEPFINTALWTDSEAVNRIALMFEKIRKVIKESKLNDLTINPNDYSKVEKLPGTNCDTVDKIKEYIKTWQSYGHHISGTAKMGKLCDETSVVDSRLRVKGISNLRVIDASIYPSPNLHAYNPSRGIYMMAEVAADFIKKEHNL